MSNFTIDCSFRRIHLVPRIKLRLLKGLLASLLLILISNSFTLTAQQHTDENRDMTLRGSGRVNTSTLGLELTIPLGIYPGRGLDVPVSISYSSKVWRTEYVTSQSRVNNPGACISINTLKFAERSASGWTSSLAVPYIEYTGADNLYNSKGFALSEECQTSTPGGALDNAYVKRVTVHLPSGESHELRANDFITTYPPGTSPAPIDFNATFYAVDSSNIKYIEDSGSGTFKLMLPDGSIYDFSTTKEALSVSEPRLVRKAHKYSDRNGNTLLYDPATGTLTDTISRSFEAPVGLEPPLSPTTESSPQIFKLPGIGGSQIEYGLHWKRLMGGSQDESAMTDISDSRYRLKYKADRYSSNPYQNTRPAGTFLFGSEWEAWVHDEGAGLFNPVVLTKIDIPDGASYEFSYDNYGRIEQVKYPKGGEEHYTYDTVPTLARTAPGDVSRQTNFGVVERNVYTDVEDSPPYVWYYSATHVAPAGYRVTEISPDGIKRERFLYRGTDPSPDVGFGTFGFEDALAGRTYEERVFDRNDTLLQRSTTQWGKSLNPIENVPGYVQMAEWHPRMNYTERFVYDPRTGTGLKALQKFGYEFDTALGDIETPILLNRTYTYGYEAAPNAGSVPAFGTSPDSIPAPVNVTGSANLIRYEKSTYLINDPLIPDPVKQDYMDRNVIGLLTAEERFDGSGILVSRTRTIFDQPGYSPSVGRGNPTEEKTWDSTRGSADDENTYLSVTNKWDEFGNLIEETDALGNKATFEFDPEYHAFPISVSGPIPDPDGRHGSDESLIQTSEYDASTGLITNTVDANGLRTETTYDEQTLRVSSTRQFIGTTQVGAAVQWVYNNEPHDTWTRVREQIDESSWTDNVTHYDGLGRPARTEESNTAGKIVVRKEFDAEGRTRRVSSPYRDGDEPVWTSREYDSAGRVILITGPDGSKTRIDHGILVSDKRGVSKTITDPAGRSRTGVIDSVGRMVRVIEDPTGQNLKTDYVFDIEGRVRKTIQGEQSRYFLYDSLGRLAYSKQPEQEPNARFTKNDPVTGNSEWAEHLEYDENSNVIAYTDSRNITVSSEYDALNRIVRRSFSDGTPEVSFQYDGTGLPNYPARAKGRLTRISSSVSESHFLAFDEVGRVREYEQKTGDGSFRTLYDYNLRGQLIAEVYPSGRRMQFEVNPDGELDAVLGTRNGNASAKTYLSRIERNASGAIRKQRLGNGRWETAGFNERDQVTDVGLGYAETDSSILELKLGYEDADNNGSLSTQSISYAGLEEPIIQEYEYDGLNRLTSVTESNGGGSTWQESFSYDRFGNRSFNTANTTTVSDFNKTTNPGFESANNRMVSDQDGDSRPDYVYDSAGNLIQDAENKRFQYSAENRIKHFFRGSNQGATPDATYEYDGEGRRVRKISESNETVFVYDAFGKLIAEYSEDIPELPKISYLTRDHLGSTRVVTDGAGAIVSRSDYMAFGESLIQKLGNISGREAAYGYGAEGDLRKQYTGYERDNESGLDFAQARYYSAPQGRFTSVDPLTASASLRNPQTFNRYSYVLNSPYKFVDPLGLISQSTSACGQFCSNAVGNGFSGGTVFDAVWMAGRPEEVDSEFRYPSQKKKKEKEAKNAARQSPVQAPQSLVAEATNRFVSVTIVEGDSETAGFLQMTLEMNALWITSLDEAFSRGVEVGAAARASQGVVVVTGMSNGADAGASVTVSGNEKGGSVSVQTRGGKHMSKQQENLGASVSKMDVSARALNTSRAIGAAAVLQDSMVNVSTAGGIVQANADYSFFSTGFRREIDLIYRRGVKMGYLGTYGPGISDKIQIKNIR